MPRAKAAKAPGAGKAAKGARAPGAEEAKAPGAEEAKAPDAAGVARLLFATRRRFDFTCAVPDPTAFALDLDRNLLRLLKRKLTGACYQQALVLEVEGYAARGDLTALPDSLRGEFQIHVIGVRALCWVAQPGDLVLGRIRQKMSGGTFVEGEAPTRFTAQVMDEAGVNVEAVQACPLKTLLPLRVGAMEYTLWERFASGTVVLAGPEPTLEVTVDSALSPETAAALLPLVEKIESLGGLGPGEGFFAGLFRVAETPAGPAAALSDLGAAIRKAAGDGEPVDLSGGWRYAPTTGLRMARVEAERPRATVGADEFCRVFVRRVLLCRHAIGVLAREYADPKKRAIAQSVWRAMGMAD